MCRPCFTVARFLRKQKWYFLIFFRSNAGCASGMEHVVMLYSHTSRPVHTVSLLILDLLTLFLFAFYWPIYNLLRAKNNNNNNKKRIKSVWAIVYFFKNGTHASFPMEQGEGCFLICHSSINAPPALLPPLPHLSPFSSYLFPSLVFTSPLLKREMRGGSPDNWPCVSWVVWSRKATEATHLRAAQQTVKCSTGGRTRLQREQGTRAV